MLAFKMQLEDSYFSFRRIQRCSEHDFISFEKTAADRCAALRTLSNLSLLMSSSTPVLFVIEALFDESLEVDIDALIPSLKNFMASLQPERTLQWYDSILHPHFFSLAHTHTYIVLNFDVKITNLKLK